MSSLDMLKSFGQQMTKVLKQTEDSPWENGVNLEEMNVAANKNGSTDNVFDATELDSFLMELGVNNPDDRTALIKNILGDKTTISAEDLMSMLDTDDNKTINTDEFNTKLTENGIQNIVM